MRRIVLVFLATAGPLLSQSLARTPSAVQQVEAHAPPGTGLIAGQIIDGTTRKPVPEALVDLLPQVAPTSPTSTNGTPRLRVLTDSSGRFYFSDLPPGRYNFRTNKAGYLESRGSRRRPTGFTNSYASPLDLADGQKVFDWTLPLWKFGVISGTVVDEAGDPAVGVEVRPLRRTFVGGRPRFSIVLASVAATDDRGMYRLASLAPGDYAISVPTTMTSFPASVMEGPPTGFLGNAEVSGAIREVSILGSPTNQRIGDTILLTLNRAPRPPAPIGGRVAAYLPIFHPALPGSPPSGVISVGAGEEQIANLQLRLTACANVSGTLSGPNGPLAKTAIRLVPASLGESTAEAEQETATGVTDERGAFTLLGVSTGQYLLKALTPRFGGGPTAPSTSQKPVLWATEPVTIGDTDVAGLMVAARPTLTITGRLEFRGQGDPPLAKELADWYVNIDSMSGGPSAITTTDTNGSFVTGVPAGKYSVRADSPTGWHVKGIEFAGRDATDGPIEIKRDATLVFALTDQRTQLSGVVRDERGQPDADGLVGVFPSRREWWTDYPVTGWRVRGAQTSATGAYSMENLPAGDYFVVSIPDAIAEQWVNPANLEALTRTAVRVTIADGDKRTQDLKKAAAR